MTKVIVLPGLTLNQVTDDDLDRIRTSGGPATEVVVCNFTENPDQTKQEAADADVILGIVPPELFAAAPQVKWVQSISSGVDSFMYPEFINNPVVLTSEKGLVGEHLADHGFGLLLMLTRHDGAGGRMELWCTTVGNM